ncbi:MAG: UDP-glucose 6-dehydrogenase [Candidatus Altiarchaeales archaeon HGW-Altiarchaeales-2]|nr:MAG: UDP-glucose 6-dehydrogenase [Candidatus Altiarchaeales archaeon HGW-Altiarchaeales-2]
MKISIIGTGYVGLVTGVCLTDMGNNVVCVDIVKEKVEAINEGKAIIYEEGLEQILRKNLKEKRIRATTDIKDAVKYADVIFISVGTPSRENKAIDLGFIENTSCEIGKALKEQNNYKVIAVKSTVVPGTTENVVIPLLEEFSGKKAGSDFGVCMIPEFLREGRAIYDFMNPDRIIIGEYDKKSGDKILELFKSFSCPVLRTNLRTAEMIKYASNAFLATKISFINEIANICELKGIDVNEVAEGIGLDKRIGPHFLHAGIGFGGSCFPKDVSALISSIGLSFKRDSDDMREAPSISIINFLLKEKCTIQTYDPKATENAKKIFGNRINYCKNIDECLNDANVCIIASDWDEFKEIYDKFELMKNKIVIDGRRILNPEKCKNAKIKYYGVGYKNG